MSIVRQVDSDYEGDGMVAFIDSTPRYRKGPNVWDECITGETYRVELHRKPLDASGRAFKFCAHEHREIDAAIRCARRLMRSLRGRIPNARAIIRCTKCGGSGSLPDMTCCSVCGGGGIEVQR
jgi:hypothetical protein